MPGTENFNTPGATPRVPPFVLVTLALATLLSAAIWALHAPRFFVFTPESYGSFWNRKAWMLLHVGGGTVPLFLGPLLLWSGLQRWRPRLHRWAGRTYLIVGGLGVGGGAILSLIAAQPPRGLYVATFTLALAWFAAAGMAYRAIRNRQIVAHREWVIRSYVLTVTFVTCRLAMRLPAIVDMGGEAITAVIWVNWIVALLITEIALQWHRGGPVPFRD